MQAGEISVNDNLQRGVLKKGKMFEVDNVPSELVQAWRNCNTDVLMTICAAIAVIKYDRQMNDNLKTQPLFKIIIRKAETSKKSSQQSHA